MTIVSTFLLIVSICIITCKEALGGEWPYDLPNPFKISQYQVDLEKLYEIEKQNIKRYRLTTGLKKKCGYNMRAEAINVAGKEQIFLRLYVDQKLLDVLSYIGKRDGSELNVLKNLYFIHKMSDYSCERLEIEYLMEENNYKICKTVMYGKQKVYKWEDNNRFLEDWQWRVIDKDQDCEGWSKESFQAEFASKYKKIVTSKKP